MATHTKILPGKKKLLSLVVLVLGTALFSLWVSNTNKETSTIDVSEDATPRIVSESGETLAYMTDDDTDGDGLKDWEETLWTTDPSNPDTDGDGTVDGKEVVLGRNPSIASPHDVFDITMQETSLPQNISSTTAEVDQSQTARFSELFIETYLNSGMLQAPFTSQVDTFANLAVPSLPAQKMYTQSELSIINTTVENIHTYGNSIGHIFKKNAPNVENELVILLQAIESDNIISLQQINKTAGAYRKNAEDLLAVPVPEEIAPLHIQLVNAFALVARDIEHLALFFDDPLSALAGLESYFQSSNTLSSTLKEVIDVLNKRTTYKADEDGYMFTNAL